MKISPILQKIAKHYGLFSAENGIKANRQKSDLVLGTRIDHLADESARWSIWIL